MWLSDLMKPARKRKSFSLDDLFRYFSAEFRSLNDRMDKLIQTVEHMKYMETRTGPTGLPKPAGIFPDERKRNN